MKFYRCIILILLIQCLCSVCIAQSITATPTPPATSFKVEEGKSLNTTIYIGTIGFANKGTQQIRVILESGSVKTLLNSYDLDILASPFPWDMTITIEASQVGTNAVVYAEIEKLTGGTVYKSSNIPVSLVPPNNTPPAPDPPSPGACTDIQNITLVPSWPSYNPANETVDCLLTWNEDKSLGNTPPELVFNSILINNVVYNPKYHSQMYNGKWAMSFKTTVCQLNTITIQVWINRSPDDPLTCKKGAKLMVEYPGSLSYSRDCNVYRTYVDAINQWVPIITHNPSPSSGQIKLLPGYHFKSGGYIPGPFGVPNSVDYRIAQCPPVSPSGRSAGIQEDNLTMESLMVENQEAELLSYPNPATDYITVYIKNPSNTESQLQIFDKASNRVHTATVAPGQAEVRLDVSKLRADTYYLRISSSEKTTMTRIVVK